MNDDDVEVLEHATPYSGYMKLDTYILRHKVFDRGWSGDISREVLERGQAVAVLPYDARNDAVVLLEQFRIGGFSAAGFSPWQIECAAGMIEPGDDPEATALRELTEETGLRASELVAMHHYLTSPGATSETLKLYCGRVDSTGAGGIHGLAHEHEYLRVFVCAAAEAFAMTEDGRIANGMTIIALHWLRLHHEELRNRWSP